MSVYKADNQQLEIWHDTFFYCEDHDGWDICISPDCEMEKQTGYFAALGQPGCLFDSDVMGPYSSEQEAYDDINNTFFDNELVAWSNRND